MQPTQIEGVITPAPSQCHSRLRIQARPTEEEDSNSEEEEVKSLSEAGIKPSKILRVMHTNKGGGESLLATENVIPFVHLNNQLGDFDYSTFVKTDHYGTLKALFFCHHASLKIYSAYNKIVFANRTSKKNKFLFFFLHLCLGVLHYGCTNLGVQKQTLWNQLL
ncbi:uncharacterized protein VP01_4516g1 [Puccinia sorghi]|uniref:Uncharacterized protein n=1 Tax=Puccinia sorghi TaxID=27349 RepID=A0A0L6UP14_9BASI|nr:uncharacterized protein VP01_4516g1 [Puccinia sorghi]